MKLTKKQEAFIQEYLTNGFNATQAYLKAGYKVKNAKSASVLAQRLLGKVSIQKKIQEELKKRQAKYEATTENIINELSAIAFANIFDLFEMQEDGTLIFKSFDKIPEEIKKAVQSITYDPKTGYIKVKLYSKEKALELLGKHLGLFEGDTPNKEELNRLSQVIEALKNGNNIQS